MANPIRKVAEEALSLGISVLPPAEDGSKKPGTGAWKQYQDEPATFDQVAAWYGPRTGLGFVCGKVSFGLELFEFDDGDTYRRFKEAAAGIGQADLIARIEEGYLEETPGGGVHWFYYTDDVRGSTKLACRSDPEAGPKAIKTLIETKGEGGFVIVAPTFGRVHPSGRPYRLISGDISSICSVSKDERDWLWDLARSFDEVDTGKVRVAEEKAGSVATAARRFANDWPDTVSPGDDFEKRTPWSDILTEWTFVFKHGDTEYWRRPGKDFGHSATINHTGTNHLHVFSSSTSFEPNTSYSRFAAYAQLSHGGDFTAAAKALYQAGYGTHRCWVQEQGRWVARIFQNPLAKGHRLSKPDEPPPDHQTTNGKSHAETAGSAAESAEDYENLSDGELGLTRASDIAPEPVAWEWPNRIARGKFNLIAGEGGDGKSQLAIAIVAAVSRGGTFPDGSGPAEPGNCIILAAEDGPRDTIIPRLIAAGADGDRVIINSAKVTFKDKKGRATISPVSFQDLAYWEVILKRHDVRVLVADPVPAYLGRGVNDNRNNEIRAILEPFGELTDRLGVAFIAITHFSKSKDHKSPLHQILGSVAYYNFARTVHCTYRDKDDPERRLLCMTKGSVVGKQPSLAFTVEPVNFKHNEREIKTSKVQFEVESVDYDPAAELNGARTGRGRPPSLKSAEWLWDHLTGQTWVPFVKIVDAAGEAGFLGKQKEDGNWPSLNALYRARDRVNDLPSPRNGWVIDEQRLPFGKMNKDLLHWRLTSEDAPPY